MIKIMPESTERMLAVKASDTLTDDDYIGTWLPALEAIIEKYEVANALLYMDAVFAAVDLGMILGEQYVWAAWLGFFAMLPAIDSHRGWTHTWWAMLLVPMPILLVPMLVQGVESVSVFLPFYGAFCAGYFSHLLLDGKFV